MHRALMFVGPSAIGEQARQAGIDLGLGAGGGNTRHIAQAIRELRRTG